MVRLFMLVIISISYIQLSYANNDYLFSFHKRNDDQYCGRKLVSALQLICNGVYNPMFKKSSYHDFFSDELRNNWMKGNYKDIKEVIQYPFKHRQYAMSLAPETFRRRRREGIYDECCKKSCTIHELAEYCGGQ